MPHKNTKIPKGIPAILTQLAERVAAQDKARAGGWGGTAYISVDLTLAEARWIGAQLAPLAGGGTFEPGVLRAALLPFAHPDLSMTVGGNVEGDDSPVYGRNKAVLTLGHFRAARRVLGGDV